ANMRTVNLFYSQQADIPQLHNGATAASFVLPSPYHLALAHVKQATGGRSCQARECE
ncbi:MAG: hypothetical protein L6R42_008082, partial [Xanthoria sp. 1 TBL-2021]